MPKKIENPLTSGLPAKIYFLSYVNPQTGYKIAQKIYGSAKTEKIYKWGKKLRTQSYLKNKKIFTAKIEPLVLQIKNEMRQQAIQLSKEEESELEVNLKKLLSSKAFKQYVVGFYNRFESKVEYSDDAHVESLSQEFNALKLIAETIGMVSTICYVKKKFK
ncbi:MAG: hypothetical protein ACRD92_08020, partial [Nitrosopumilaceae archaeon]